MRSGSARPSATTETTDGEAEPGGRLGDQAHAPGVDVDRDHEAFVADPLGDRGGLAAGRGGEVGDPLARLRVEHRDDRLARLILRGGATVTHCGQPRRVADAPHDQRLLDEGAALGMRTRARDLDAHPARVAAARVHPQGDRAGLVHRRQRGACGVGAELGVEALDHPVGVRERDRIARRAPATAGRAG